MITSQAEVVNCCVSKDDEEQESSHDVRGKHFTEYINSRKDWKLTGIYADDGISGTNTKKRDQFNKMMQSYLKKNRIFWKQEPILKDSKD